MFPLKSIKNEIAKISSYPPSKENAGAIMTKYIIQFNFVFFSLFVSWAIRFYLFYMPTIIVVSFFGSFVFDQNNKKTVFFYIS